MESIYIDILILDNTDAESHNMSLVHPTYSIDISAMHYNTFLKTYQRKASLVCLLCVNLISLWPHSYILHCDLSSSIPIRWCTAMHQHITVRQLRNTDTATPNIIACRIAWRECEIATCRWCNAEAWARNVVSVTSTIPSIPLPLSALLKNGWRTSFSEYSMNEMNGVEQ